MAPVERPLPKDETNQEYRVQVTSKKHVMGQIHKYKDILKTALDGQPEVSEETKRVLLQELLANFEAAVQDNVLVNAQPWDEAPDVEGDSELRLYIYNISQSVNKALFNEATFPASPLPLRHSAEDDDEAMDLEILLDDVIVETTRRRRAYPKKILPHVVHSLKAERKVMGLYEHAVKPQELLRDPGQESIMKDLSAAAPVMVKQAIQVIKSINSLQKQAEGLCEILGMKPSHASLEIHREVFGVDGQSDAPPPPPPPSARSRRPIARAVEEAAAADCYVPLCKPE